MLGRKRRGRPPAALMPSLERDERVITWSRTAESPVGSTAGAAGTGTGTGAELGRPGAVVATTRGLFLPGLPRLGWHQIHKVTWAELRLTVMASTQVGEGDGYLVMADDAPVVTVLAGADDLADQIRRRVTGSVAFTHHQELPGGGVRVVARRVPGRNGVVWHVRYDAGTDRTDPEVVAFTAELVAEAAKPDELD